MKRCIYAGIMGPGGRGSGGLLGSVTRQRSPGAASCRVAGGTCTSVDLTELAHQIAKPSSPGSTVRIRPSAEGRAKPPLRDRQRKTVSVREILFPARLNHRTDTTFCIFDGDTHMVTGC